MANLLNVPDEIKLKVLSYLSYDEISRIRVVSREINRMCADTLNTGFAQAENFHAMVQKEIKVQLPRRESERRDHPYSRHADILSAIETRMSLLQITYAKYIEAGYSCFIPGKVLDELFRVLRFVRTAKEPPRSHEVLMELRDISSMAMEHFEDKILPPLRKVLEEEGVAILPGGLTVGLEPNDKRSPNRSYLKRRSCAMTPPSGSLLVKRRRLSPDFGVIASPSSSGTPSFSHPADVMVERVTECERVIDLQNKKIDEQSRSLTELNKKLTDYNHRFNDLADMLSNHYESSLLQDKIAALIQPVRGTDLSPTPSTAKDSTAPISSTYTSIVSRATRRYGKCTTKTPEQRAKALKDNMDVFRDQCKF